jgi:phosphoglycerate dehydrogenase-like enzyme
MRTLHVYLPDPPDPQAEAGFRASLASSIQLSIGPDLPNPADYHILVSGRPARRDLEASPNLHTLIIPWAGVAEETRRLARQFPHLSVHNLHHNAAATAEMAVALLLAAAKLTVPFDRALRGNDWRPRYEPTPALLLEGKTALILGFGQIGQRIGRVCQALGMEMLAVRRSLEKRLEVSYPVRVYGLAELPDLLRRAQALIIALPATPETESLIGPDELYRLPAGSLLVNIGRGRIIDQAALYEALASRRLAGAGLDVWWNYPEKADRRTDTPPSDFPFHQLDNVVMSPHRGGATRESEGLRLKHLAELLNAAGTGAPLPNKVDLEAGY